MSQSNEIDNFGIPVFISLEELRKSIGINKKYFYKVLYSKDRLYKPIKIPKRNGTVRTLNVPEIALKGMQRWILDNILYKIPIDSSATGFVPSKSTITNATPHINKKNIIKMDIRNFFPSINFTKVKKIFLDVGFEKDISIALANICTYQNQLPQGAPTSPYLANLVCKEMDRRISILCKNNNLTYTRYADDITISGRNKVFWVKNIVEKIVKTYHFSLNEEKTIALKPGDRKRVTGLIVNDKLSVPKSISRSLRKNIYFIKKFGLEEHLQKINFEDISEKYVSHLYGIASYIKMVELEKGLFFISQLDSIFYKENRIEHERQLDFNFESIEWTIFDE